MALASLQRRPVGTSGAQARPSDLQEGAPPPASSGGEVPGQGLVGVTLSQHPIPSLPVMSGGAWTSYYALHRASGFAFAN